MIPATGATFTGSATDADGIGAVRIYVFDETRNRYTVGNASAAYNSATRIWTFSVLAAHLSPGGFARLWVQATDLAGTASDWQVRRVQVAGPAAVDTTAPLVSITSPASGATILATASSPFAGIATDAGGITVIRIYVFDEARNRYTVTNVPAAYNPATTQWSFTLQPAHVSAGSFARLWVQAVDAAGNAGAWQVRRVQVTSLVSPPDTTAPVVTIATPANGAVVPAAGTSFAGTATDDGDVGTVRIYVFDETRNTYTVSNALAAYAGATGSWSFPVLASHISPGGFARLWVQAGDAAGNVSPWQFRRVVVGQPIESLGPSRVTVSGTRLLLEQRLRNGSLSPARPLKLRGVAYSPVDPGETIDTRAAARQHLRDSRYQEDFELLQQLGANAIKTYADVGTDGTAIAILNEAYERGLMVAVTLDLNAAEVQAVVGAYKNHPALLCWLIGNEWNLNRFFRPLTIAEATTQVEQTARLIKSLDANHPVASGLGFSLSDFNLGPDIVSREFPGIVTGAPSVDVWGLNVYRSGSFDPLFLEWRLVSPKPFMLTEFGTDDWNAEVGRVDEATQADTGAALWDDIHRHLSANDAAHQCVGGFAFAWNDEWWKMGNPAAQDQSGFQLEQPILQPGTDAPIATFRGHPDGVSNEEHYGLVDMSRQRKQIFGVLQQGFRLGTLRTDPLSLGVRAAGNGTSGYALFTKRGLPVSVAQTAGVHLMTIDRSTGTAETFRTFDTTAAPQTQCPALLSHVRSLRAGDLVLAGVAPNALAPGVMMSSPVMAPCLEALALLGSRRALDIGAQTPWALIATAGAAAPNLAEGLGSATQPVQVTAEAFLDADRDGLTDQLDADNDNDGMSDAAERNEGTDILERLTK